MGGMGAWTCWSLVWCCGPVGYGRPVRRNWCGATGRSQREPPSKLQRCQVRQGTIVTIKILNESTTSPPITNNRQSEVIIRKRKHKILIVRDYMAKLK